MDFKQIKSNLLRNFVNKKKLTEEEKVEKFKSDLKFCAYFTVIFLLFRFFVYDWYIIPSCSMVPTLLIGDGPTFGGLMCSANIIYADLWIIGQTIPGRDKIHFVQTTQEEAKQARIEQMQMLKKADLVIR